jgi:hypothetical protein
MKKQQKDKSVKLNGLLNKMSDDQTDKSENDTKVLLDSKQIMKNFLIKMKEEMQANR